jgi:hypothetical protein
MDSGALPDKYKRMGINELTDKDRAEIREAAIAGATNAEIIALSAKLRRKSGLRQPCLFITKDLTTFEREVPFSEREGCVVTTASMVVGGGSMETVYYSNYAEIAPGIYEEIVK